MTNIILPRAVIEQVIEALSSCGSNGKKYSNHSAQWFNEEEVEEAITALRAALEASKEVEPVADDVRYLRKWLNEELTAPIDRQALARVLASITHPAPAVPEFRCPYCKHEQPYAEIRCHNCAATYTIDAAPEVKK